MIQIQIELNATNNSGAWKLMCVRVLGVSNRKYAHIGDVMIAVVKEAISNMPFKKTRSN
jgi:large subunit ribosomal protein L14